MIALVRLYLLITWRQVGGRALLIGAGIGPAVVGVTARLSLAPDDGLGAVTVNLRTSAVGVLVAGLVLLTAGGVGHRVALIGADERLSRRSRLLSSAGFGAGRVAVALSLFGLALSTIVTLVATTTLFITMGPLLEPGGWVALGLLGLLAGASLAPPAAIAGLRLSRVPAYLLVDVTALALAVHAIRVNEWLRDPQGVAAFAPACLLLLLGPLLLLTLRSPHALMGRGWP